MKTPTSTHSTFKPSKTHHDPRQRLSLAVRELDKLINRANQLASLSEQSFSKIASAQVYPLSHKYHTNPRISDS